MEKKNLLYGLVIFLLVLYIATIATVLVYINKPEPKSIPAGTMQQITEPPRVNEGQRVQFMAQRLGLTEDQQEEFRKASQNYNMEARRISSAMQLLRDQLLEEMDRDVPDTVQLNDLSGQIGMKHVDLKKLTVDYYLTLKQQCTKEQKRELFLMFKTILNPAGEVSIRDGQGPPSESRRGRGQQGRGNRWRNSSDSTTN